MSIEQERADFEAWAAQHGHDLDGVMLLSKPPQFSHYVDRATQAAFEAYQAGRASLQSQNRGYAVERLIEVVRYYMSFGCPVCSGDCFSANPPVDACPVREAQEAIDHARRAEGETNG